MATAAVALLFAALMQAPGRIRSDANVEIYPAAISALEGSNTSYNMRLSTQPNSTVIVAISSLASAAPMGQSGDACGKTWPGSQTIVHTPELVFSTANWPVSDNKVARRTY